MEYSHCHKMQILGYDKKKLIPKRLPPLKKRQQMQLLNTLSPAADKGAVKIQIEENLIVDAPQESGHQRSMSHNPPVSSGYQIQIGNPTPNTGQIMNYEDSERVEGTPELEKLPKIVKKVERVGSQGVILMFRSMEIVLKFAGEYDEAESPRRKKEKMNHSVKLNASEMMLLLKYTDEAIYNICKKALDITPESGFLLQIKKAIIREFAIDADETKGFHFNNKELLHFKLNVYEFSMKSVIVSFSRTYSSTSGPTIELYVPETGQFEKLRLTHGQLKELIEHRYENISGYVNYQSRILKALTLGT